jgi:hypothetical protein
VAIDRIALTAEDSFAAILARNKLGIAIAAMMRMIATTINNSIRENPLFRLMVAILTIPELRAISAL